MIIVQVAHITNTPGPVQSLGSFLQKKSFRACFQIFHPLEDNHLGSKLIRNNRVLAKSRVWGPGPIKYLSTFFITLSWLPKLPSRINLAIGMNCFDTFALIIARKFKKIDRLIFFNTDFSRRRFNNPVLNYFYILIDRFAARHADRLCCNSRRTIQARVNEGIKKNKIIYTPNGVFLANIGQVKNKKSFNRQLVYVGHLTQDHNLSQFIPLIRNTKLKLIIIGSGPDKERLISLAKNNLSPNQYQFLGQLEHHQVISFLKKFTGLGLAPYRTQADWTYYADPVKVKEYFACLVPPVINNKAEIAKLINNQSLGLIYQRSPKKVINKINNLTQVDYQKMITNLKKVRRQFDYQTIYSKIFD